MYHKGNTDLSMTKSSSWISDYILTHYNWNTFQAIYLHKHSSEIKMKLQQNRNFSKENPPSLYMYTHTLSLSSGIGASMLLNGSCCVTVTMPLHSNILVNSQINLIGHIEIALWSDWILFLRFQRFHCCYLNSQWCMYFRCNILNY